MATPRTRRALLTLVGLVAVLAMAACQGSSPHPAAARTGSHPAAARPSTPAAEPTSRPKVVVVSAPRPIPPLGPNGRYLVERPPGGARPAVPADEAVATALRHQEGRSPTGVTAAFGLLRGQPTWFVTFQGVCKGYGLPPGIGRTPCQLNSETAVVNATSGDWELTYWDSAG